MKLTKPVIVEIGYQTYAISQYGLSEIFLLVGEKRGLVIDTGSGILDIRAVIESLTDLPYKVVLTHGHGDHSSGAPLFPEVHVHPADIPLFEHPEFGWAHTKVFSDYMGKTGAYNLYDFNALTDTKTYDRVPKWIPVREGFVFDLGGRQVTVHEMPGHSEGSIGLVDSGSRVLFSGDAISPTGVGLEFAVISTALRGYLGIRELAGKSYDRIINSHARFRDDLNFFSIPIQVLDDVIEALRRLLAGTAEIVQVPFVVDPNRLIPSVRYGRVTIGFDPERLWEKYEPHVVP